MLVHTDGTIFAVDGNSIMGIDPLTGSAKFAIPLETGIANGECLINRPASPGGTVTYSQARVLRTTSSAYSIFAILARPHSFHKRSQLPIRI